MINEAWQWECDMCGTNGIVLDDCEIELMKLEDDDGIAIDLCPACAETTGIKALFDAAHKRAAEAYANRLGHGATQKEGTS